MKLFLTRTLLGLIVFLLSNFVSKGQVVINEICPTNISINQNSNGDYDDWIELHNSGGAPVNLAGYGLTDDMTEPFRFTFPSYTLGAGQKVLVFASDFTNEVIANHWEMPVDAATTWKYAAGSAGLDTNWRNPGFNQTPWTNGTGGIGFGDGDDATTIAIGASVMMRKTFTIPDTSQILKAVLMMDYDDGFVAYLNGVEIARSNIGTVGYRPLWNELANSSHEAQRYQSLPLDSFYISRKLLKSIIVPGTNVLAIEVHNTPANNNDLSSIPYLFFGMKSSGSTFPAIPSWFLVPPVEYFNAHFKLTRIGETVYLNNPGGTSIDQKTYPAMESDNSLCRKPDGSSTWCFVSTPTPGASNNSSTCYSGYAIAPIFSKSAGFYSSTQILSLTSPSGGTIRYTTNGNIPTASSPAYSSPINISSSKTIRARVFLAGSLPSPVVTNSYFINEVTHLSSFSITTDSANLWDYNTGIYVLGPGAAATSPYKGANFWQDWEKPASIEYFDKNKNLVVKFNADIKIYGNYSRAKPQKSWEIKLSDKYGLGSFDYPMYPDKPFVDDINNIVLRNSGTDWNKVHFRDALMERILKPTFTGYLSAEPTIAFVNGEYWGVYCINENHDHHWMKTNFGLDKSEIDYLKESGSSPEIQEGSDATFWELYNYATVQSPSTQAYYDYVNARLDLKNYTDYFAAETFYNNGDWIGDWTNNIQMWRPNDPGSKWRYLVYDLDFGLGLQTSVNEDRLAIARNPSAHSTSSEMFDAILDNPTYKRYFINRYADLINTIFLPSNMDAVMKSFRDTMAFDMVNHFAKWGSSVSSWNNNIDDMMDFANARPNIVRDFIKTDFSLAGKVTLTLQSSPAGAGRIEISTIIPSTYPWSGVYFNGNPVTITAIPNPGYTFDHFRSTNTITSNNFNQSVTYNYASNDVITAFFTGSSVTPQVCVSELNYNSRSENDAGDWIELHNYGSTTLDISNWKLSDGADNHMYVFPTGTKIAPNGYLVVCEDTAKFDFQFPTVNNRIGVTGFNFSDAGDEIRLFNHLGNVYLNFNYLDLAPWPLLADGEGYTCELISNAANPNDGNNWFAGCIGGSPGKAYSPILAIPVTINGTTTFCSGNSATLHATYVNGYAYQWKLNNVNIPGATDSILVATQSGAYSVGVSYQGCSIITPATTISVVTQQPAPQTIPAARCGPGEVSLIASSSDSVYWYDAPSGGNLIWAGDTLVSYLTQTTTYYAKTGINCASTPVATTGTIRTEAASPVASNVSRCGPGTVTLNATDTAAIRWYTAASGGGLIALGSSFTTNNINYDTAYYVEAGSVCPSPRIEVLVTVNTSPLPTTTDDSRCGSGVVSLTATAGNPIAWFTSQYGGGSIATGGSYSPNLSVTDTFYVEANGGCPSPRVRAIGIIIQLPPTPVVHDSAICSPGSVMLSAIGTEQVNWYDAASGGNNVFIGSEFQTPVLNSSTTYYVESGYECYSPRVPVHAIISSAPPAPTATDVSRCGTGSVTLTASSTETIYWYNAPTGGTLLATSSSYNTPSLSSTTTYYVEAGTYCRSPRIAVQAIINQAPAAPTTSNVTRCGSGTVDLAASATQTISWFSVPSGGSALATGTTFTTPVLASTTTYYVEAGTVCKSPRIAVQAIIAAPISAPVLTGSSRCGQGTLTLTATSSGTVTWYSTSSGGVALGTGLSFITPTLSSTTTYYAQADNGCTSTRSSTQAVVNPIPAAPTSSNVSRCGNGTVTLVATSPEQIFWFTVPTGGSSVFTGASFTTPTLSSTTTYYVETGNTCRSTRISVQAIINALPSSPTLTAGSNCGPGSVMLSAMSTSTVNWFAAASGGSSLGSGLTFNTPSISTTTTYYAQASNGTCTSPRVPVIATINSVPATPNATGGSRCGTGSVTLTATGSSQLLWFDVASGGTSVGSGTSFNTPNISATTNYYVESDNGNCSSTRILVSAVVTPQPAPPLASDATRCGPGQFTLTASAPQQIYWYDAPTGGTLLMTGSTYTTGFLSSNEDFYVETGSATCRSNRIEVEADIVSQPNPPVLFDSSRCEDGIVTLRAVSPILVSWFNVPTGGTALDTGLLFLTPFINASTTYYAEAGLGCNSTRIPVQAVINFPPSPPVAADSTRCGPGSLTLHASATEQLRWYDASVGGNLLFTGSNFTTPVLSNTTTFYVEAGDVCPSARVAVDAITGGTQVTSFIIGSHCGPGSVILSASASVPHDSILWFDAPGGNNIGSGGHYITPFLSATTTYYVVARSGCTGPPVAVVANIFALPTVDLGPDTIVIQSGQTTNLDPGSFDSYLWSTGDSSSNLIVSTTGEYSVVVTDVNGCTGTDVVFVDVVTSVGTISTKSLLKVFPNPAHDQLTILLPEKSSKSLSLRLFSADGKIIYADEVRPEKGLFTKTLSLSGIAAGVYYLEAGNDEFSTVVKVLVQ